MKHPPPLFPTREIDAPGARPPLSEERGADLSPDRRHRWSLWRVWDASLPRVAWIGLNPSTADADTDDQTIRRCRTMTRAWGGGSFVMLNLYAYRATDPRDLWAIADAELEGLEQPGTAVGRENDGVIRLHATGASRVIAAWGDFPRARPRVLEVAAMLHRAGVELQVLGLTAGDAPRHPSRAPGGLVPHAWSPTHRGLDSRTLWEIADRVRGLKGATARPQDLAALLEIGTRAPSEAAALAGIAARIQAAPPLERPRGRQLIDGEAPPDLARRHIAAELRDIGGRILDGSTPWSPA